jgi:catechol 2,3-dioxygenase-like lactoylglutathione lyase family enzyme
VGVLGVNHIAFRTRDPDALRTFYAQLTGAEPLDAAHGALRVGTALLVFFPTDLESVVSDDADEIAFDVDAAGFAGALAEAERLGCVAREPVDHTPWSRGFLVRDPDGRRIEFVHDDRSVYWRE